MISRRIARWWCALRGGHRREAVTLSCYWRTQTGGWHRHSQPGGWACGRCMATDLLPLTVPVAPTREVWIDGMAAHFDGAPHV